MKRIQYLLSMAILAAGCMLASCNNAEYDAIDNSLYIADAAVSLSQEKTVAVDSVGASFDIIVRLAKHVDYDVQVQISVDTAVLKAYNEQHNTSYRLLPEQYRDFFQDSTIVINKHDMAGVLNVNVYTFEFQTEKYALPVTVRSLNSNVPTSESLSHYVFVFDKKFIYDDHYITAVTPKFKYVSGNGPALSARPFDGWDLVLPAYTLEFWARMEMYSTQNFALFSIYSWGRGVPDDHEFYFRFGDGNSTTNTGNGTKPYINWKPWGLNVNGGFDLIANKWVHWACVYDGTFLYIYRDGEIYRKVRCKYEGENWIMDGVVMVTSHANTANTMNMAEVRLWRKALTTEQVKAAMYYEIEPNQPDLEAYWKMNEGSNFNGLFIDATGNGHDAEINTRALTGFGWTDPQTFRP